MILMMIDVDSKNTLCGGLAVYAVTQWPDKTYSKYVCHISRAGAEDSLNFAVVRIPNWGQKNKQNQNIRYDL